jgi:HAE1 family hydrophobic/amphiphilic exporter-1
MMSARLLRTEDAKGGHAPGHHHDTVSDAGSRKGFYALIDRAYTWLLRLAMHHRIAVSVVALAVALSSIPLYRVVKQEYTPSDVDEAEFDVNVNAPEGTNIIAMDETMRAIEKDLMDTPGVRLILSSAGGSFLGAVNQGSVYVRIAPHDERVFSLTKLWNSIKAGHPLMAFRGNYTQRDVMQEIRARMQKYAPFRFGVRNAQSFNIGGGNYDIDFVFRGPDLQSLAKYAETLRQKTISKEIPGIVDADTTLKLDKPELRVHINRDRAADLGVDTANIATALRLMVGGDDQVSRFYDPTVNEDYDVQLRLSESDRGDQSQISRLYVPSSRGGLVRVDNLARRESIGWIDSGRPRSAPAWRRGSRSPIGWTP